MVIQTEIVKILENGKSPQNTESEDEAIPTTLRAAPKAIIIEHANSPGNPTFPVRGTEPSASQLPQL